MRGPRAREGAAYTYGVAALVFGLGFVCGSMFYPCAPSSCGAGPASSGREGVRVDKASLQSMGCRQMALYEFDGARLRAMCGVSGARSSVGAVRPPIGHEGIVPAGRSSVFRPMVAISSGSSRGGGDAAGEHNHGDDHSAMVVHATKTLDALLKQTANIPPVREPLHTIKSSPMPHKRPEKRLFSSPAVEQVIEMIGRRMKDEELAMLFTNCFPNTLDTTVEHFDEAMPDAFIITGDIHAQWLRDSTNQMMPYLPLIQSDPRLERLSCGLIHRQTADVLIDPFANAFNRVFEGVAGHDAEFQRDVRTPPMQPHVYEGKYELDSLASVLRLSNKFAAAGGKLECFDPVWAHSMKLIMDVIELQMKGTDEETNPPYKFQRGHILGNGGRGPRAGSCGLSKNGFRPSDDPATLPFLIPANMMARVELQQMAALLERLQKASQTWQWNGQPRPSHTAGKLYPGVNLSERLNLNALAERARTLSDVGAGTAQPFSCVQRINAAIEKHGKASDAQGAYFLYEVDCLGQTISDMDDANLPSLMSIPMMGYATKDDPVYKRTRERSLSRSNQWYFEGKVAKGIGSPHWLENGRHMIWPLSLIVQAFTSDDEEEIKRCLQYLKVSSARTGFLHESFNADDPARWTRDWFAWVNSLFGQLVVHLAVTHPKTIF